MKKTPAPALPACGLARRFAAIIYDGLLLVGVLMMATLIIVIPAGSEVINLAFQFYLLVVAWGYFAVCWRGGQTLGMKAWRIGIEGASQPIDWWSTVVRFAVATVSWVPAGLGYWWGLFRHDKACWHDLASGTRLVVLPKPDAKAVE
ncbi:MAG: RDD family protein [Wenzhouxiangella sp.]